MDNELDFEIKNLLSSNEKLEIPDKISNGIDEVLKKISNEQKRKRWIKRSSIAATLFFVIVIGLGTAFPALAQQVPIINKILGGKSLFNKGIVLNDLDNAKNVKDNSMAVEKTVTDNGITITLKEIAYDKAAIYIIYQVNGNIPVNIFRELNTLSINGKSYEAENHNYIGYRKIDNNTIQVAQMYFLNADDNFSDKFNVSVKFTEMQWKSGNWQFNMTLDKNELAKNSKQIDFNKEVPFNSGKAVVRSLIQSSSFATLTVDYDDYKEGSDYFAWSLVDKTGTELKQTGLNKVTKKDNKTEVLYVYMLNKNTKIEKIIENQCLNNDYTKQIKDKNYVELNDKFPKTVSIGSGKEIIINKIDTGEDIIELPSNEKDSNGKPPSVSSVKSKFKYYELTLYAKEISMQDYLAHGGIAIHDKNIDNHQGTISVVGNNIYKVKFSGYNLNDQASNKVLSFGQYDEVLKQAAEIDIQ